MRISDLGEFGVIDRIARCLPPSPADVLLGIGDDVAVLKTSDQGYLLATCDIQVENTHFVRDLISPYQLGRKVVAINVSDIAAMGGNPKWALVSLALPADTAVAFVDELYRGMQEQIGAAGAAIIGGNLSKISQTIVIDVFLMGQVAPDQFVCRSGAQEGDAILVTGTVGDSKAGLELLLNKDWAVGDSARQQCLGRHLTPSPRLAEGQALAKSGLVHAMLDVSDGTLNDLGHICEASKVGAEIWVDDLPASAACREVARAAGCGHWDWALSGGEDYELLFTVAAPDAARVQLLLEAQTGTTARVIGRILARNRGLVLSFPDGSVRSHAGAGGWDHFKEESKP